MKEYIKEIIIPYVQHQREFIEDDTPALVIMDNFKGQVTTSINDLLEKMISILVYCQLTP